MDEIFRFAKSIWFTVRSNPIFVAFEGAFFGSLGSAIEDELNSGRLDFSHSGIKKLVIHALAAAFVAIRLLVRPAPTTAAK